MTAANIIEFFCFLDEFCKYFEPELKKRAISTSGKLHRNRPGRIPTELIPHTPDGQPVSMNLRCDDTFVEDSHWHQQAQRYSDFVRTASDRRLLLLEFGVGFNTPVIIRFPFEQMAAQFPDTTLVRFNRDYPQLSTQGISRYVAFTEGVEQIIQECTA